LLQYNFDESVGYWICTTSHAMRRALDAELAREKITLRQWEVLAWIALEGEQSQVELAERLGIEAPTLAGVLTRMERDGWLERYCCQEDRRRKRLRATPKAESVWNRMVECCDRVRDRATDGIAPEELAQFKLTCEKIRANLGAEVGALAEAHAS
jgi:MarR family transcriptional regulator for hemolysin